MQKLLKPQYLFIAIFLVVLIYAFTNNEIMPLDYVRINDEKNYIDLVRNFSFHLSMRDFIPYYNSRLLIPAVAHYIIQFLHLDYTTVTIRNVFLFLNFLSILIALVYFLKIAKKNKYSESTVILGLSFLFINFFILKLSNFYPVLMDVFGFTSGVVLYYYHTVKNKAMFFICLLLSMFIFPTTILILAALLASAFIVFDKNGLDLKKHHTTYTLIFFIPAAAFIIFFYFRYITQNTTSILNLQFSTQIVFLTMFILLVYIFFCLKYILLLFDRINFNRKFSTFYIILGPLLIFVFYFFLSKYLSVNFHGAEILSSKLFISNLVYQALSFPIKFLVSHFIYYGVFVSFILYYHKAFLRYVGNLDPFQKIIITIFIFLSVGTETRQFIQLFPFIAFAFLNSIKKLDVNFKFISGIFVFQLIWSRFWYTINVPEGFLSKSFPGPDFSEFPAQRYFQFQGPWLSENNAYIYCAVFLISFTVLAILLKYSINPKQSSFSQKGQLND